MKKTIQSILSMILCAMIVITGIKTGTAQAAAKTPFTVAFQKKSVTLAEDVFGDIHITPKELEKKWGKPKKTTEDSDTSYTWKKGKTSIKYSVNTKTFTMISIDIKDKNGEFLGVKVGMKKATVLKKLKKVLGVTEADITKNDNEEILWLPLSGVIPNIGFIDGKVSHISYCGYVVEEPAKKEQDTKPVISSSKVKIKQNSCTVTKGKKVKLTAKYGKTDITKKGTWKSSKKSVATISKTGVLTAKKAGTTYITVKYKDKTSKKLKVVVKGSTSASASSKDITITYNKNSKNKEDKLNGSDKQTIATNSGEIIEFSTTVKTASGHEFLGWYDAPKGGNRIYETYKPTKSMTLYAHYTDQNVQKVNFVLGCNYGGTYSFMSENGEDLLQYHWRDYNWLEKKTGGPMHPNDKGNVVWTHTFEVSNNKKTFLVDDLPVPEIPGYTFVGWYTTDQGKDPAATRGKKIDSNTEVSTDIGDLGARFTKKLTISFDDLRGGRYDDIVIDSYKSIKDCGQKLPVPNIPGATFLGWTMDADNNAKNWSKPIITEDSVFLNCIEWFGFMCSDCCSITKHMINKYHYKTDSCIGCFATINDDWHVYEETDHFTLYPVYKFQRVDLYFDPKGGYFPYDEYDENHLLTFEDGIDKWDYNHKTVGKYANCRGSEPYDWTTIPGHGLDAEGDNAGWYYGDGNKFMPIVERNHYVFDKWVYLDENGNEVDFTFNTILSKTMTVYAKWNPGTCFVHYDATDGTITQAERDRVGLNIMSRYSVTTESTIASDQKQMPIPVSSEGRTFEGWYTEDGERVDENTQILDDTTLYAHWGV